MNEHKIDFGSTEIHFNLEYKDRKTLKISVHPDLSVKAQAPKGEKLEKIKKKMKKRAPWILKQKEKFQTYLPATPPRKYVSGETHRYRGKQYRLKIIKTPGKEQVKLKGAFLCLYIQELPNPVKAQQLLEKWYRKHAQAIFAKRLQVCTQLLQRSPLKLSQTPELQLRKMSKRWGSCTSKGKILLNPELIKVPTKCLDYVIIHELCHIKFRRHSGSFYELLALVMPDWERWKQRLEEVSS